MRNVFIILGMFKYDIIDELNMNFISLKGNLFLSSYISFQYNLGPLIGAVT